MIRANSTYQDARRVPFVTMRTLGALVVSAALLGGVGLAHAASEIPTPPDQFVVHPVDTFKPRLPMQCSVERKIRAEQHRTTAGQRQVREMLVFKLDCPKGDRTVVRRGPWLRLPSGGTPPTPDPSSPTPPGSPGTPTQGP